MPNKLGKPQRPRRYPGPAQRKEEKPEFEQKVLELRRVTRVVAGGKRFNFRAAVVIGNKNGKVGVGVAKGQDVSSAVEKAVRDAKKNLIAVPLVNRTIPHQTAAKYGTAKVLLKSASPGYGLIAGSAVRVVCSLAGINNVSSKILSVSKNKLNIAKAAVEALKKLKVKKT